MQAILREDCNKLVAISVRALSGALHLTSFSPREILDRQQVMSSDTALRQEPYFDSEA